MAEINSKQPEQGRPAPPHNDPQHGRGTTGGYATIDPSGHGHSTQGDGHGRAELRGANQGGSSSRRQGCGHCGGQGCDQCGGRGGHQGGSQTCGRCGGGGCNQCGGRRCGHCGGRGCGQCGGQGSGQGGQGGGQGGQGGVHGGGGHGGQGGGHGGQGGGHGGQGGGHGGQGGGHGGQGGGLPPGRPVHVTGSSDGTITGGIGAPGAIGSIGTRPPNVWPGSRTDLYLPMLAIRTAIGDTAQRPVTGVFWESPDIFVLPGVAPLDAPATPPANLGGVAKSNANNTLYAHVWNYGQAAAYGALVEFYWFNPALGFDSKGANLVGIASVDLASRSEPGSHRLVKCPHSWVAKYENGGHECLVVRVSHPVTDPLASPPWDASQNRQVGQRNIHVMTASEAAAAGFRRLETAAVGTVNVRAANVAATATSGPPIGINVGPLYGQGAQVDVKRADTATMPWLHLVTNSRTKLPATGTADGSIGISAPASSAVGAHGPTDSATQTVTGDGMQIGFKTTDGNPGAGNAHVYRISGTQSGQVFGGYTVVILGE